MATNGNTAAELLAEYSRRLDPVFHEYFEAKMLEASGISPHCRNMVACIREFTLHGGKRIRPALVYYGYKCFADGNEDEILKASISMELLHSYLLIHDDIMDGDALRRNCPTVHKIYESTPYAAAYRSAQDYGVAMGILAGDIGFGMAMDIILSAGFPIETRLRAARKLVDVATGVCHGQTLDIISSCNDEAGPDDAMLVNRYKTAFYTIEGPLCIGAALGGASDQDLAAFRDYALPLGEAFQIRDDILGLYGNQEKLGKPIGADLKEGKRTLLILKALDMADSEGHAAIENVLGNPSITEADVETVRSIVKSCGAYDETLGVARSLMQQSSAALPHFVPSDVRHCLTKIADYLVAREN